MTDGYSRGKSRRERAKIRFSRSFDGRIKTSKPVQNDADIGEVWANQEQIGLANAMEEEKRRLERKQLRKERGLVGVAKTNLSSAHRKVKTELFGEQASKPKADPHTTAEIESFLHEEAPKPKLHKRILNSASGRWSGVSESMQPVIIAVAGIAAVILILFGGYVIYKGISNHYKKTDSNYASTGSNQGTLNLDSGKLDPSTQKYKGSPDFKTITRDGKPASDYGGWYKVSTEKTDNPVFAYPDNLGGNILTVSERELPPSIKADPSVMPEAAKELGATGKTLDANGTTIYLGTQKGGKQTAAFVKDNLLIVINSTETLKDQYWIAYAIRMV